MLADVVRTRSASTRGGEPAIDRASGRLADPWAILRALPGPAVLAAVAVVYLVLAQLVIWLNDPVSLGAGFWPGAGLSLALLLLLDRRQWPWILAGVALAEIAGDLAHGYAPGAIAFWTLGNVVEPLVGAWLLMRWCDGHREPTPLASLLAFLAFGVVVAPLVGATLGSFGTVVFGHRDVLAVWPKYVIGDALGVLVVAPALLTWTAQRPSRSRLEAALLVAGSALVTLLVFRNWEVGWDATLPYLIVPFLSWGALRFGIPGAARLSFGVAAIAQVATALGYGPFATTGGSQYAIVLLQVFLGIAIMTALLLAALASDLTDSKELARRLAATSAAELRNREFRDAFVGVLSHEIRTPITTIYGMSELLRTRHHTMQPETIRQYLDDIAQDADRLRRLTEDLLVLGRAEGGRLDLASNPVMIAHLVRTTVESERLRLAQHRLVVKGPPARLPLVLGEDVYVEQILRNFLGNAAKYSPPGTTITVVLGHEDGGVAVRVIDAGRGLPEGPPERLFEVFYRAPDAIGTTSGAGIGLFICLRLAEAMSGRVWAAPGPDGTGAEFGFWLPDADERDLGES